MRKLLLSVLTAAALAGGCSMEASAAPVPGVAAEAATVVAGPVAAVQEVQYYGGGWRAREWQRREEWRRREAWRRRHHERAWRERGYGRY